ncbi:tetratricopeptide repeat protein [Sphingosinicella rhizophila]|uniref:Tetratricopeptide repeat protein n=1 Tax=Sphingosinicella rhizophila TaxID=3050082 RepID=A0ABU3Q2K8_9SPHN|nr:tetratricopeptide repeat protein [Sphingosinicella sp. GR2756]MDT9597527.1 hypothetical protein [Sphingosinicella sp. GR2756]
MIWALGIFAGAMVVPAVAAHASVEDSEVLAAYVQARAADASGALGQSARLHGAALALDPNNKILAARTLRQAIAAGDRPLAVQAARILDKAGELAPDGRMLVMAEALRRKQWKEAGLQIDGIEEDEVFSFLTPLLRGWLAFGARKGDPLAFLNQASTNALADAYAAEHRPLLLLARGKKEGVAELAKAASDDRAHSQRLRIAGAAILADEGDRKAALTLLEGDLPPIAIAREQLVAGKKLKGAIDTAQAGVAQLLVRLAVDLNAQNAGQLALSFARVATFLAPENSETWLVTSELLAAQDQHEAGLAAIANITADDPFASTAADTKLKLLIAAGRQEEALSQAEAAVAQPDADADDWARLGDLHVRMERPEDGAEAYGEAIARADSAVPGSTPKWALWLMRGSALIEADHWPEAKTALQTAYKLGPQEAQVLNYLGYSQLERRENMEEAERLIREASRLQPNDAAITDSLGWAYYLRGNLIDAIKTLEKAVQGQPADVTINEHLGDAYYSAGRRIDARYAWNAALVYADEEAAVRLRAKIEKGLKPELVSP